MPRVTVRLKDLKPNPFYKHIRGGKLNEVLVERLADSIEGLGFWENIVCRRVGLAYEIAHGHHRIEAAKRKLGPDHKVSLQLARYDDGQMIRAMWWEDTVKKEESMGAWIDMVRLAKKHLIQNPKACRFRPPSGRKGPGRPHKHGSIDCVSAFLEDKKWGRTKVAGLLLMGSGALSPEVLQKIAGLGTKSGTHIARLKDHRAQETLADMVEKHSFNQRDVQEVVSDVIEFADPDETQEEAVSEAALRIIKDRDRRTITSARKKAATSKKVEGHDTLTYMEGAIELLKKLETKYFMLSTIKKEWWLEPSQRMNIIIGQLRGKAEIVYKMHREIFEPMRRLALEEAKMEEGGKDGRRERKVPGVRVDGKRLADATVSGERLRQGQII